MTGLRERKRRDARARIEAVALELFAAKGFDETTVDDIARAAEVSRATVFRYFGSKDDIVYGVEPMLLDEIRRLVRESDTLAEAIVAYADLVDVEVQDLGARAAIIAMTPRLVERFAHVRSKWDVAVAHGVAERREPGALPTLEEKVAAASAMSALFVAFQTWAVTPGSTLGALTRQALRVLPAAAEPVTRGGPGAKS